jgi:GT2 family glycosyltransferase
LGRNVSTIIATHNGRHYLDDCLRSVLSELRSGDEVIVVDNASTDGSADFVVGHYPQVRIVRNAGNRGFAAACNQGAALASGDILVFLNQDTRVAPGWLEALVQGLDGHPEVGLTTSQVRMLAWPDRIQACGQDVHYAGLVFARGFGLPAGSLNGAAPVGAVAGCSFAMRREVWQELDGLDETLYMYYEETDLSWRARLRGYRSLYVPDSVIYHDYRPSQPTPFHLYHTARNRRILLFKNWRWRTLFLLTPALLLAELVEWGQALGQGWAGLKAKLRADLWLARHLGLLGKLHARAQAGRSFPDAEILTERLGVLRPQEMSLGMVANLCVMAGNSLFSIHHRLTKTLCRWARL